MTQRISGSRFADSSTGPENKPYKGQGNNTKSDLLVKLYYRKVSWNPIEFLHNQKKNIYQIIGECNKLEAYQATQIGDVQEHQTLIVSHLVNFCSEKQHKGPSFAVTNTQKRKLLDNDNSGARGELSFKINLPAEKLHCLCDAKTVCLD